MVESDLPSVVPNGRERTRSPKPPYTKAFDDLRRELFCRNPAVQNYGVWRQVTFPSTFRAVDAKICQGEGVQTIEMQFLADIELPCEACGGMRYKNDVGWE